MTPSNLRPAKAPEGYGFVYALTEPETGVIRYVGKTGGNINSRFAGHLREARATTTRTHKLGWIRKVLSGGSVPGLWSTGQRSWPQSPRGRRCEKLG